LKVLIIEDSPDVAEAVSLCLQLRWPEVILSTAAEGSKGVETLESDSFDIVVLDINLPDIDGFEVIRQIRTFSDVPVIFLTVRGKEADKVRGLEMGADDYIVKPFSPVDFLARVNAVLRRARTPMLAGEPSITRGTLVLNLPKDEVHFRNEVVKLTPTECRLMYVLMKNSGHTLSSRELLQQAWGEKLEDTESLRTYVRRVRSKLRDNPPQIIISERGQGYRFVDPS